MGDLRAILKKASKPAGSLSREEASGDNLANGGAMTSIYVTHDQEEAFAIADRIVVVNAGKVEQMGAPLDLYRRPETVFVARFLGMENLMPAELSRENPGVIHCPIGQLHITTAIDSVHGSVTLLIRPGAAELVYHDGPETNTLAGRLIDISFRGRHQIAVVELPAGDDFARLKFYFASTVKLPPLL